MAQGFRLQIKGTAVARVADMADISLRERRVTRIVVVTGIEITWDGHIERKDTDRKLKVGKFVFTVVERNERVSDWPISIHHLVYIIPSVEFSIQVVTFCILKSVSRKA